MREIVSLHIGQAGIQTGMDCWDLFCREHGINCEGYRESSNDQNENYRTFFSESDSGKLVPRAVFVDLEPTVVNQIRKHKQLLFIALPVNLSQLSNSFFKHLISHNLLLCQIQPAYLL